MGWGVKPTKNKFRDGVPKDHSHPPPKYKNKEVNPLKNPTPSINQRTQPPTRPTTKRRLKTVIKDNDKDKNSYNDNDNHNDSDNNRNKRTATTTTTTTTTTAAATTTTTTRTTLTTTAQECTRRAPGERQESPRKAAGSPRQPRQPREAQGPPKSPKELQEPKLTSLLKRM